MNSITMQKIYLFGSLTMAYVSSCISAQGSILVYNNSLYTVKCIVTNQDAHNKIFYTQATLAAAPTNSDGSLQVHPVDEHYTADSHVPVGTVANVTFEHTPLNFDLQILDAAGKVVQQINIGSSLGKIVDNDPLRAVYIYSNLNSAGIPIPHGGGTIVYWDAAHPLEHPFVKNFVAKGA